MTKQELDEIRTAFERDYDPYFWSKMNQEPPEDPERLAVTHVGQLLALIRELGFEPSDEPSAELFNQVGQLLAGWKQGCAPGEWSDFDESVLKQWQAWRVSQMPCPRDDLPSACGERFGPGFHHECRLQPNHAGKCRCSCGAENR